LNHLLEFYGVHTDACRFHSHFPGISGLAGCPLILILHLVLFYASCKDRPKWSMLPYLTGKVCYCLALRPPLGPMHIPELTLRLLEPLGVFSKLQECAPVFLSLFACN